MQVLVVWDPHVCATQPQNISSRDAEDLIQTCLAFCVTKGDNGRAVYPVCKNPNLAKVQPLLHKLGQRTDADQAALADAMHGVSALLQTSDCTLENVRKDRVGFVVKVCNCSDLSKEIEVRQLLYLVFRPCLLDAHVVQGAVAHRAVLGWCHAGCRGKHSLWMDSFFREGGDALLGEGNCRSTAGTCCSSEHKGEGKAEEGQFVPGSRPFF
jgi:hypothetical protein